MKDKNYSLIDTITKAIKISRERTVLLKQIKTFLKKGIGRFKIDIEYDENVDYLETIGFTLDKKGQYQFIFSDKKVTKYEVTCFD